jgi:ankyrin repeat protein
LAAVEIVNLLIEEGAPLALKNRAGETPLDLIFKYVQNPVAVLQSKVFDEQIKVRYKFTN